MKKIVSLLLLFFVGVMQAQQLNCTVQINSDKVASTNNQIFKNLKNSISLTSYTSFSDSVLPEVVENIFPPPL